MGIFDFLGGGQAQMPGQAQQPGFMQKLLAPEVALPMAAALMGGQGNAANLGNAFAAGGQGMAQQKQLQAQTAQQNRTLDFFRQQAPEYAQMIDAGMPVNDAFKLYTEQRYSQKSNLINAGDGQLYDPSSKQWISAPGGSQKAPQVVELFDEGTGQPYKATWDQQTGQYQRVGGIKAPSGMQVEMGPDGTFSLTQGPLGKGKKLSVEEGKNAGFLVRADESHKVISSLEEQGTSLGNKVLRNVPGGLGNYGLSPESQKFEQAKRDFVNSVLRRESGAVISEEEFANAEQQYFPQPGDGPEVIAQKRTNRENAIRGFEIGAGAGVDQARPAGSVQRFRFNPETGEFE